MTGMPEQRVSGGDRFVRADVARSEIEVERGKHSSVAVEVTNVDDVIRSYQVSVLGLDREWIAVDHDVLDLFPGERRQVELSFRLPEDFPAGRRRVAVEISDARRGVEGDDRNRGAVMVGFDLVLAVREAIELTIEPVSQTIGKTGSFVLSLHNTGNTTLDVVLAADEPERQVEVTFDPPVPQVLSGERRPVTVTAVGQRPWFGMPVVRTLEFSATGGSVTATTIGVLIQRPRISRRVLAFLGLLLVAVLFFFVIRESFNRVALRAEANEQLLRQGLGEDQRIGMPASLGLIGGQITSTTGGPIDGAAVELFDAETPDRPAQATVTNASGVYRFGSLPEGTYLLRVDVAGFAEVWYRNGATIADAEPIELAPGSELPDIDVPLAGRPGSVAGTVLGADVEGAVVTVAIPAEAVEGSEVLVPAVVAATELDATGQFVIPDLPTPASYELIVAKPGFATERSTVNLAPGEQRGDLQILLRTGDGRIMGTVVDTSGTPLPNVDIGATEGSSSSQTRTLSGPDDIGTFELRDLPTPATYTLTITADGYFPGSITLVLDEGQQIPDLSIVMTADVGSLSGRVTAPDGTPLGGVDITIDGDEEITTVSLSAGDVGSWFVSGLPVPGTYTITFSQPGRVTQALSVELVSGAQANRSGIDAVLSRATSSVRGTVSEPGGELISGVEVALVSSSVERRTRTSDRPIGAYGFDDLPPGPYTITYSRPGSESQTLLVDLVAGEDRVLPVITLAAQARFTGRVTRSGVGEAGVGVVALPLATYPGVVAAQTVTGPGGEFTIVGLDAPQTYVIEFQAPAGGPVVASETRFLAPGETIDLEVDL